MMVIRTHAARDSREGSFGRVLLKGAARWSAYRRVPFRGRVLERRVELGRRRPSQRDAPPQIELGQLIILRAARSCHTRQAVRAIDCWALHAVVGYGALGRWPPTRWRRLVVVPRAVSRDSGESSGRVLSPSPWMRVTVPRRRRTYRSRPPTTRHHPVKGNTASPTGAWPARRPGAAAPLDPVAAAAGRASVAHHRLGASRRCSSGGRPSAKAVPTKPHPNKPPRPRPSGRRDPAPFAPSFQLFFQGHPTRRA